MGRRKKIEDSCSRSILFPRKLVEQVEAAAENRGTTASDVVRELLEDGITEYLQESSAIGQKHFLDVIDAAKNDVLVCALFEKYKSKKELVMPLCTGLDGKQQSTLQKALLANRRLERLTNSGGK